MPLNPDYAQRLRMLWREIANCIFPPDDIERAAQRASYDSLSQVQRPHPIGPLPHSLALFDFNAPHIRTLIHAVKYRHHRDVAILFGVLLAEAVTEELWVGDEYHIVPVALSPQKYRKRGYNQAAWIADAILSGLPRGQALLSPSALRRIRDTKSQTGLSRTARLENVRHAFHADESKVRGRHILLVDDVATTGATVSDARRALYEAGAASVFIAVIASDAR